MKVIKSGGGSLSLDQVNSLTTGSVVQNIVNSKVYLTSDGGLVCLSSGEFREWKAFGAPRFIHYPNAEVHLK